MKERPCDLNKTKHKQKKTHKEQQEYSLHQTGELGLLLISNLSDNLNSTLGTTLT